MKKSYSINVEHLDVPGSSKKSFFSALTYLVKTFDNKEFDVFDVWEMLKNKGVEIKTNKQKSLVSTSLVRLSQKGLIEQTHKGGGCLKDGTANKSKYKYDASQLKNE